MQVTQSVVNQSSVLAERQTITQSTNSPNNLANPANNLGVDSATEKNAVQKPSQRFRVDERTIALLDAREQEKQSSANFAQQQVTQDPVSQNQLSQDQLSQSQATQRASDNQLANQTDNQNSGTSNTATGYDLPSQQNQTAVAAYQAVGNAAQREDISQIFGVDLFA